MAVAETPIAIEASRQAERVLKRRGCTPEKMAALIALRAGITALPPAGTSVDLDLPDDLHIVFQHNVIMVLTASEYRRHRKLAGGFVAYRTVLEPLAGPQN